MVTEEELTDSQQVVLSVLHVISGSLSIAGSSTIVYRVLSNQGRASSYDRIMLSLSICDIIASSGWVLTPLLLPSATSSRPWAIGSDATCNFLGFVTQLGFAAVLYNCFLSFYYLLTVRYGVKRQMFAHKYEPWVHGFCVLFSILTASVGAIKGFFSEMDVGLGCWVNNYPAGCIGDECISDEIAWAYGAGPVLITFISLLINNVIVYIHVRRVFSRNQPEESERRKRQKMQKREVATQGFLYVASFFFSFWPTAVVRALEAFSTSEDESSIEDGIYWLLVIQAFTLPFQGVLNVIVYNRPNYRRIRAAYPDISHFAAIRMACFDPDIPSLQEITNSKTNNASITQSANNKYRNRSLSGAAFKSSLQQIEEGSDEGEYDFDEEDENDDDIDSTHQKFPSGIDAESNHNDDIANSIKKSNVHELHQSMEQSLAISQTERENEDDMQMLRTKRVTMDGSVDVSEKGEIAWE